MFLSALKDVCGMMANKQVTKGDCTCGKCKEGWYSPRMEFLIKSQASWMSSLLFSESFQFGERGERFHKKDFIKSAAFLPFEFPQSGYVKSFIMGYVNSVDRIVLNSPPPFITSVAFPHTFEDQRMWTYFLEKGGDETWALKFITDYIKNNYAELLEMYYTSIMKLPVCNNDWKFDVVTNNLFHNPTDLSEEVVQEEKRNQQIYETVCEKMKNISTENEPPKFVKKHIPHKMDTCTHPKRGRRKVCVDCCFDSEHDRLLSEYEKAFCTFEKCPHTTRPKDWEGMCQGCHSLTESYPMWWHSVRKGEHKKEMKKALEDSSNPSSSTLSSTIHDLDDKATDQGSTKKQRKE